MKSLTQFINEELDDNIWWLLDKWFERNELQAQEFIELVKNIIKGTQIEKHLKQFINFIDNEVNPINNKDYLYSLKQIIETVLGKKEKNKYLNY